MNKILAIFVAFLLLFHLNSCTEYKAKTVPKSSIDIYEPEIVSFESINLDSKIVLNSLIDSKHYYYDTCLNNNIAQILESDKILGLNFVDLPLLKFYAQTDTSIKKEDLIIFKERKKILPRTNFEHYVLGGMFDGGIYLYDLYDYKAICFFSFRINNSNLEESLIQKFGEKANLKINF